MLAFRALQMGVDMLWTIFENSTCRSPCTFRHVVAGRSANATLNCYLSAGMFRVVLT
jgi:hypothetical protein